MAARRAGQKRRLKAIEPEALRLLGLAAAIRRGRSDGSVAMTPAAARALGGVHSASSWNRYLSTLRAWELYTSSRGLVFLPADPGHFANFLAEMAEGELGNTQTKQRSCAIRAISIVAGVRSPLSDPDVEAVRLGIRGRARGGRRGGARPIYAHEIPRTPPPSPPGGGRGRWAVAPASIRRRAKAQVTRHMRVLSGASLRFDDLQEGQLGDVIWHPDMADLSLFGTKTDRLLVGQPAVLPASSSPESGFQSLLEGARDGLRRLGELDPAALGAVARRFAAACTPQELGAGSSEMRFWPEEVQTLAAPLYAGGLPVHCLPIFGAWQFERLTTDSDLRRAVPYRDFVTLSRGILHDAGVDTTRFGAHSFRQGGAGAMLHAGAPSETVSEVLRHRSALSTRPYILEASRMASTALTLAACARRGGARGRAGARALLPRGRATSRGAASHPRAARVNPADPEVEPFLHAPGRSAIPVAAGDAGAIPPMVLLGGARLVHPVPGAHDSGRLSLLEPGFVRPATPDGR